MGTEVSLEAICHQPGSPLTTCQLAKIDLRVMTERLLFLRQLTNFSALIFLVSRKISGVYLVERYAKMELCLDLPSDRGDKSIKFKGDYVRKTFHKPSGAAHVEMLREIYSLLKEKQVPNVDRLVNSSTTPKPSVCLEPIGNPVKPRSELEALVCILEALEVGVWAFFVRPLYLDAKLKIRCFLNVQYFGFYGR